MRLSIASQILAHADEIKRMFVYNKNEHSLWKRTFDRKLQKHTGWDELIPQTANRGQTTLSIKGKVLQIRMAHLVWYLVHNEWPEKLKFKNGNILNIYLPNLNNDKPRDDLQVLSVTHYHKSKPLPSKEFFKTYLAYNPLTGKFRWKVRQGPYAPQWNARYAGKIAGKIKETGHISITIEGVSYLAHRVAWKMYTGKDPKYEIDHDDGEYSNNRIKNLFDVESSLNQINMKTPRDNTSGHIGVAKKRNKWRAFISQGQKQISLGVYVNIEDAIKARKEAEIKLQFHVNHGRLTA